MKPILLSCKILKSALLCAARNDIRYYLNGVCIKAADKEMQYLGTDGRILFVAETKLEEAASESIAVTIPGGVVENVLLSYEKIRKNNSKLDTVALTRLEDGRYALGNLIFTPIDGVYPDTEKVIPKKCSGEEATFNVRLLYVLSKAVSKATYVSIVEVVLHKNGDSGAVVVGEDSSIFGVIMPMKADEQKKSWEYPRKESLQGS